jgi:hypothetical protein
MYTLKSPIILSPEEKTNHDYKTLTIENSNLNEKISLKYESDDTEEDISMKPYLEKKYKKIINPPSPLRYDQVYKSIKKQQQINRNFEKEYNNSYRYELKLLEEYNFNCDNNWNIKNEFVYINIRKLNEYIKNQFYNKTLLDLNTCVINNLLYSKLTYLSFFSSIEAINPNSKSKQETQLIASTNFKGYLNDNLIIKFDINKYTLHEVCCGLLVGNEMRKIIPTFVWTYGITKCTSPILSKDGKNILTACNEYIEYPPSIPEKESDNEYISVIIEKLEGLSLYNYIKNRKLSQSQLVSILLIVFSSISMANKKFGFVHNDLHSENINMKPLNRYSCIKLPNKNLYINTFDSLPIIFDFGLSVFENNGKKLGNFDFVDIGIDPYNSDPMQDVIKLLIDLQKSTNDKFVNELLELLIEDKETIRLIYDNYSYIPNLSKLIKYNIDEFIDVIISLSERYSFKDLVVEKGELPILNYEESDSINKEQIKKLIFNKRDLDNIIDLDFYLKKDNLTREDLQKIFLFLLYFEDSFREFNEKSPSENLKQETVLIKFFKIRNHIDIGIYVIKLLNKLEKEHNVQNIGEIRESIEEHINKLKVIMKKYREMMIIKKDYYLCPRILNKNVKNILMNEKYIE